MLANDALRHGIALWAKHARVENMGVERLLATIRKVAPEKAPLAASVISSGYLQQLRQEHTKAKGEDPCSVTRRQLLASGMPLRAGAKQRQRERDRKESRAWIIWAAEKTAQRKATGVVLRGAAKGAEMRRLAAEFKALSPQEKAPYLSAQRARQVAPPPQQPAAAAPKPDAAAAYCRQVGDRLWGMSSLGQPFSEAEVDAQVLGLAMHTLWEDLSIGHAAGLGADLCPPQGLCSARRGPG